MISVHNRHINRDTLKTHIGVATGDWVRGPGLLYSLSSYWGGGREGR